MQTPPVVEGDQVDWLPAGLTNESSVFYLLRKMVWAREDSGYYTGMFLGRIGAGEATTVIPVRQNNSETGVNYSRSGELLIVRQGVGFFFVHGDAEVLADTLGYSFLFPCFNDRHDIVGQTVDYTDPEHLIVSTVLASDGRATVLSAPNDDVNAIFCPLSINSRRDVVGYLPYGDRHALPMIWRDGVFTSLPIPTDALVGYAMTVLENGDVYGAVGTYEPDIRPVVWRDGVMSYLPVPEGYIDVVPTSVNERGDYILIAERASDGTAATFLYLDGVLYDTSILPLTPDGQPLDRFRDINDKGEILTSGDFNGTHGQIYLLRPIPEHNVSACFLVSLVFCGRRNRD